MNKDMTIRELERLAEGCRDFIRDAKKNNMDPKKLNEQLEANTLVFAKRVDDFANEWRRGKWDYIR